MLRSLDETAPEEPLQAQVIVVGAGLAGLFLADELAARGLHVLILESGADTPQETETHPLNAVELEGDRYRGAEHGRFRCLGGTSTRWGGALLPYLPADFEPHPCGWHEGWGIRPEALDRTLAAAEAAFGVEPDSYEGAPSPGCDLLPGFLPREPKWPTFRNRSTANLFARRIRHDPRVETWTNATVTGIDLGANRVEGVTAQAARSGHLLRARAPVVVLTAGAIETTRLLLLLNRAQDGRLFPPDSPLGLGFHDHLSASIADLVEADRHQIARLFGFRFVKGGMRNLRFELAPRVRSEAGLPAAFLHVAFTRNPDCGFEGVRGVFQAMQRRQLPQGADLRRILFDLPWFARAVWWRMVEQRVFPPTGSGFELHLVTEQAPDPAHRITLADGTADAFGLPLARIAWRVAEADLARFRTVADLAIARWRAGTIAKVAQVRPRPDAEIDETLRSGGGIYHPAGTTRIGPTGKTSVVDVGLNVHGVPGLRALATSVFPSVGGSSPSLALVQLALRLSEDIATTLLQRIEPGGGSSRRHIAPS